MADTGDDEVVAELDVVLNKSLADQLYLLQFPMKQAKLPTFDRGQVMKSRFKPQQKAFEIDFPVDTHSPNVDPIKAEIIAENANIPYADEQGKGDTKTFQNDIMDYHTMAATSQSTTQQHALGVVHDGTLYINPVQGVLQMRPSLHYLDEKDKREKAQKEAEQAEASAGRRSKANPEAATAVKVQYKKQETARAAAARQRSYAHHKAMLDEEPWVPMPVVQKHTPRAKQTAQRLVTVGAAKERPLDTSSANYVRKLTPTPPPPVIKQRFISDIQAMPLQEGLLELMKQAQALSLDDIVRYLPDAASVLAALPSIAILVRGSWVALSTVVFGVEAEEADSPAAMAVQPLVDARDFVLACFRRGIVVKRSEVMEKFSLRKEDAELILKPLATHHSGHGWVFKMANDFAFGEQHPAVAREQETAWREIEDRLNASGVDVQRQLTGGSTSPGI